MPYDSRKEKKKEKDCEFLHSYILRFLHHSCTRFALRLGLLSFHSVRMSGSEVLIR